MTVAEASQLWLLVVAVKPRIAHQVIAAGVHYSVHRLEMKDLHFLLHAELEAIVKQLQLLVR